MLFRYVCIQRNRFALRVRISSCLRELQHLFQEDHALEYRRPVSRVGSQTRQTELIAVLVGHGLPLDGTVMDLLRPPALYLRGNPSCLYIAPQGGPRYTSFSHVLFLHEWYG